ncbi:MAG: hypothetical protein R3C53_11770 [Pirellulaceae bacterium]
MMMMPLTTNQLQATLAATAEKRRRRDRRLSPAERMERFARLQALAEETLAANPEALTAFHRRNRQQRRQSRVEELERQWRRDDGSQYG